MTGLSNWSLVSSIESEIKRAENDLKGVDENLKRLTGRDFYEPRGDRRIRVVSGTHEIEPQSKQRYPKGVFARLGAPVLEGSVDSRSRRVREVSEENGEPPKKKPLVASSVARPTFDGKTRTEAAAALTKDPADRVRNKRMFGSLLGILQRFKTDEAKLKDKDDKRAIVEKKLEEKTKIEKAKIIKERMDLVNQKRERQARIFRLNLKMARVKEHEAWEKHQRQLQKFIRTKSTPKIFWLPKITSTRCSQLMLATKEAIEKELEEERGRLKKELDQMLGDRFHENEEEDQNIEEVDMREGFGRDHLMTDYREGQGDLSQISNCSSLNNFETEEGELMNEEGEPWLSGKKRQNSERFVIQVDSSVNKEPTRRVELVSVPVSKRRVKEEPVSQNKRLKDRIAMESEKENLTNGKQKESDKSGRIVLQKGIENERVVEKVRESKKDKSRKKHEKERNAEKDKERLVVVDELEIFNGAKHSKSSSQEKEKSISLEKEMPKKDSELSLKKSKLRNNVTAIDDVDKGDATDKINIEDEPVSSINEDKGRSLREKTKSLSESEKGKSNKDETEKKKVTSDREKRSAQSDVKASTEKEKPSLREDKDESTEKEKKSHRQAKEKESAEKEKKSQKEDRDKLDKEKRPLQKGNKDATEAEKRPSLSDAKDGFDKKRQSHRESKEASVKDNRQNEAKNSVDKEKRQSQKEGKNSAEMEKRHSQREGKVAVKGDKHRSSNEDRERSKSHREERGKGKRRRSIEEDPGKDEERMEAEEVWSEDLSHISLPLEPGPAITEVVVQRVPILEEGQEDDENDHGEMHVESVLIPVTQIKKDKTVWESVPFQQHINIKKEKNPSPAPEDMPVKAKERKNSDSGSSSESSASEESSSESEESSDEEASSSNSSDSSSGSDGEKKKSASKVKGRAGKVKKPDGKSRHSARRKEEESSSSSSEENSSSSSSSDSEDSSSDDEKEGGSRDSPHSKDKKLSPQKASRKESSGDRDEARRGGDKDSSRRGNKVSSDKRDEAKLPDKQKEQSRNRNVSRDQKNKGGERNNSEKRSRSRDRGSEKSRERKKDRK